MFSVCQESEVQLCCCSCKAIATKSHHTCSCSGCPVMAYCQPELEELLEMGFPAELLGYCVRCLKANAVQPPNSDPLPEVRLSESPPDDVAHQTDEGVSST